MTSSNTQHDTIPSDYLAVIQDMLHKLAATDKEGKLTGESLRYAVQQLDSHVSRDFPSEQPSTVTESSVEDLLSTYLQRVQSRAVAAPTGLGGLDTVLNGGFQAKRLVTLLGAPGGGKTSLANQWAEKVAHERPVLYATSEDSPDVLLAKTLSRVGNVHYGDVLYGRDARAIQHAMQKVAALPSIHNLHYLDVTSGALTVAELRDRAKAHFEGKPGPGLIVVDYLQRMARAIRESAGAKELREAVTMLTERLRAIACELDCCVLAIASMNRASGYGKNGEASSLSSAKESGDIEYGSDVLMSITEDAKADKHNTSNIVSPRLLRVDKNRQGPVTAISLMWRADRQEFTPVADEEAR